MTDVSDECRRWLARVAAAETRDGLQAVVHELSPPPDLSDAELRAIGTAIGQRFSAIAERER